ncbi:MAG: dicarboxylate/amino acid:cation symporter [Fidelibacterota bacterium]
MSRKKNAHNRILIEIIIGIVIGVILGGFFPDFAVNLEILGDVFLNALMMIVVPIVMFSIITGITGIGNFRKLGSLGKNTMIYYVVTTAISVTIGLILVNIIKPGSNVITGEIHQEATYKIIQDNTHEVHLGSTQLQKKDYDEKYTVTLLDQEIVGVIDRIADNKIIVSYWIPEDAENILFIKSNNDYKYPFKITEKKLISAEPKIETQGKGIAISLHYQSEITQNEGNVFSTLRTVFVGDKVTGQEGLIPRNLFNAMINMDILPLIVFSLLLGSVITVMGEKGKMLSELFESLNDAFMILTGWILEIAPFGILGLIGSKIGSEGGFQNFIPELLAVGKYSLTIIVGLSIHGFIVLPLILLILAKKNPWEYFKGVVTPLLNAFSSASSSATLPLTIASVEKNNGVSAKTAGFVLPLGATINMDGTALYEAVAAMFIAQIYGIDLSFAQQVIIFLTATLAAIGAAGIPQAGLVTMVIVLKAVNLPVEGIGIILTVDWLLDRFRTTVNVWGDSVGAAVVDEFQDVIKN